MGHMIVCCQSCDHHYLITWSSHDCWHVSVKLFLSLVGAGCILGTVRHFQWPVRLVGPDHCSVPIMWSGGRGRSDAPLPGCSRGGEITRVYWDMQSYTEIYQSVLFQYTEIYRVILRYTKVCCFSRCGQWSQMYAQSTRQISGLPSGRAGKEKFMWYFLWGAVVAVTYPWAVCNWLSC